MKVGLDRLWMKNEMRVGLVIYYFGNKIKKLGVVVSG